MGSPPDFHDFDLTPAPGSGAAGGATPRPESPAGNGAQPRGAAALSPLPGTAAKATVPVLNGGGDAATRVLLEQILTSITALPDLDQGRSGERRWNSDAYLAAARRRWKPMLAAGLVMTLAAAVALMPRHRQFTATADMLLPSVDLPTATSSALSEIGLTQSSLTSNIQTEIAIVDSPALIETAIKDFSPAQRLEAWKTTDAVEAATKARVEAFPGVSPDIVEITTTAYTPEMAMKLTNHLIDVFDARSQQLANRTNEKNLALLSRQVKQSYALLNRAKDNLRLYKEKTGIIDLDAHLEADAQQMEELRAKQERAQEAVAAGLGDAQVQSDEQLGLLQQNLKAAQEKNAAVLRDFYPAAPEAQAAEQEVRTAQAAVDLRTSALLQMNRARLTTAQSALATQQKAALGLPRTEVQLQQLADEVELLSTAYKEVYARYTTLSLNRNAQVDSATALNLATVAFPAGKSLAGVARIGPIVRVGDGDDSGGSVGEPRFEPALIRGDRPGATLCRFWVRSPCSRARRSAACRACSRATRRLECCWKPAVCCVRIWYLLRPRRCIRYWSPAPTRVRANRCRLSIWQPPWRWTAAACCCSIATCAGLASIYWPGHRFCQDW